MKHSRRVVIILCCLIASRILVPTDVSAQSGFRTGKPLEEFLAGATSLHARRIPLGSQLSQLAADWHVAILRDRRTDPGQLMNVETGMVSRLQVLKSISSKVPDTSFHRVGSLICVGPTQAVHRLPILMELNRDHMKALRRKVSADSAKKLFAALPVRWERLSDPRSILLERARDCGVTIRNPDEIPWDLWDAASLPAMPFSDLATVILNQFDLSFEVDAEQATLSLVPIDQDKPFEFRHKLERTSRKAAEELITNYLSEVPVKWAAGSATAVADLNTQARIIGLIQDAEIGSDSPEDPASAGTLRQTLFQLKAGQTTVGKLIEYFRMNGIRIDIAEEDSQVVQEIKERSIRLDSFSEKLPGAEFFPKLFADHFRSVDVADDRIVLSN